MFFVLFDDIIAVSKNWYYFFKLVYISKDLPRGNSKLESGATISRFWYYLICALATWDRSFGSVYNSHLLFMSAYIFQSYCPCFFFFLSSVFCIYTKIPILLVPKFWSWIAAIDYRDLDNWKKPLRKRYTGGTIPQFFLIPWNGIKSVKTILFNIWITYKL